MKKEKVNDKSSLSIRDMICYGVGAIGLDLSYGMFNGKLSMYMTNVLGLHTSFLLGLVSIARIWDGINDPMMGNIVDNTNTKYGRYRPWVMLGSCLNAIVLFFLFFNPGFAPASSGGFGIYIYMAFMYILWGMTNTSADIPYWSMVPSFTTKPKERNLVATIARTFSGLGQGIILIGSPIILNALGTVGADGSHVWTQKGYTITALACGLLLVFFSFISMSKVKETVHVQPQEKFSFKKIFSVIKENDQLRVFMVFAMLSNAGFYTTTGVLDYYFDAVIGNKSALSTFNALGAVGSVLGLAVIPIMTKFTTKKRTYQTSLLIALLGYIGMFASGNNQNVLLLSIFYLVTQIGTASMFVSQTVFLADIVDYGEIKMGKRAESVTFSMKGFLQKMAYTIQTIILYLTLGLSGYNHLDKTAAGALIYTEGVKTAIGSIMYIIPPIFFVLSLIVFSTKFKLHGEFMDKITEQVEELRQERIAEAERKSSK